MKVELIYYLLLTGITLHCVCMQCIADNRVKGRQFWVFSRCNGVCTLELDWHCGWNPDVGYRSFANLCEMDFHNKCSNAKHKYKLVGYDECEELFPVTKSNTKRRYNPLRFHKLHTDADYMY